MSFIIKNFKASLNTNKNKSTFQKGMQVVFNDRIEINMLFIDGIYKGTAYFVNNIESSKEEIKELINIKGITNIRKQTIL